MNIVSPCGKIPTTHQEFAYLPEKQIDPALKNLVTIFCHGCQSIGSVRSNGQIMELRCPSDCYKLRGNYYVKYDFFRITSER